MTDATREPGVVTAPTAAADPATVATPDPAAATATAAADPATATATTGSADRARGSIRLVEQNCTSCMICARECPSWCITIDSHTEPVPDLPAGARARTENVLDRFEIDWSLCMYCGICVDECPFDALAWEPRHTDAAPSAAVLRHGIPELRT